MIGSLCLSLINVVRIGTFDDEFMGKMTSRPLKRNLDCVPPSLYLHLISTKHGRSWSRLTHLHPELVDDRPFPLSEMQVPLPRFFSFYFPAHTRGLVCHRPMNNWRRARGIDLYGGNDVGEDRVSRIWEL